MKDYSVGGYNKHDTMIFVGYRLITLLLEMWERKSVMLIRFTGLFKLGDSEY